MKVGSHEGGITKCESLFLVHSEELFQKNVIFGAQQLTQLC